MTEQFERGSRGWHSRGYLPHFDGVNVIQFVTFRLADSLPADVARYFAQNAQDPWEFDRLLDSGSGACWLKQPTIAELVEGALLHFDGDRYRLLAWCVMPNHVHVLVETVAGHTLSAVVQAWKGYTGSMANRMLGRKGAFWQNDYFDRYMRNDLQVGSTVEYIEQNPVKAGLVSEASQWRWSSARRRAAT
jgi:REP element-mobilizing transposase RayT